MFHLHKRSLSFSKGGRKEDFPLFQRGRIGGFNGDERGSVRLYILGLVIGCLLGSSLLGLALFALKNKERIKPILKTLYRKHITAKPHQSITEQRQSTKTIEDTEVGEISLTVNPSTEIGRVSALIYGSNLAPQVETEPDIIKFSKSIGITCFRFPGGDSPGYHWKTGTFDFQPRYATVPLRSIDYLIEFCKRTDTKLIMQVNVESGSAKEAAELVDYLNNKSSFRVDYWELGNEVYGDWDKGYMNGEQYAKVVKEFAEEMKKVDPTIKIGVDWATESNEHFNRTLLENAGEQIDFISVHWYPNHINESHKVNGRTHPTPYEVMAGYLKIPEIVSNAKELISKNAPNRKGKIEITFLEWDGAWDAPSSDPPPYTQGVAQWSLANAIFYADCLGQFAEQGITVSTHYTFQTIGYGLIRGWDREAGWGGQRWDGEIIRPKALAVQLYTKHFGDILIKSQVSGSPTYYKERNWWSGDYHGKVPLISCYASKFSNKNRIALVLINKHEKNDYKVNISLQSIEPNPQGKLFILTGAQLSAQNDGNPKAVQIKEFTIQNIKKEFTYKVPAHSVNVLEIDYNG